jgi:hypothetical protein
MKINTELITIMQPPKHILDDWNKHYSTFNGNVFDFLDLKEINHLDKLWVALRLLPKREVEIFGINMAALAKINTADYIAAATDYAVTVNATDAADYTAAAIEYATAAAEYATVYVASTDYAVIKKEEESQIEVLKYLFKELK